MTDDGDRTVAGNGFRLYTKAVPPLSTLSLTIPASRGLGIAVRLFWDSLGALIRRRGVTFEVRGVSR